MHATAGPYEPGSARSGGGTSPWAAGIVGCFVGFGIALVVLPVILIGGLTWLGSQIASDFEDVQAEICKANPDDPSCKPR